MSNQKFSTPVFLFLTGHNNFQTGDAWECFEYLDLHWPAARTADYRRAKALCRVAIDGIVPTEMARRAVVALAQRNGLLAATPGASKRPQPYRFVPKRANAGPLDPGISAALAGRPRKSPSMDRSL